MASQFENQEEYEAYVVEKFREWGMEKMREWGMDDKGEWRSEPRRFEEYWALSRVEGALKHHGHQETAAPPPMIKTRGAPAPGDAS